MKLSQKDINEDYDVPTPHPLQRKADPQFQDRKLPPMFDMGPPEGKSKKTKPPVIPPVARPKTRSQGPVTPPENLPGFMQARGDLVKGRHGYADYYKTFHK